MDIPLLAVVFICIILSGFFSATETAFSSVNRIRIKNLADNGDRRAALVVRVLDNYDYFISTVLVGNNIVNILAASLATVLCVRMLGDSTGPTVSTVAMTLIVLIFGEISPKTVAKKYPEKFALAAVGLIHMIGVILFPLNFVIGKWQKLLSVIFKDEEAKGITEEELISIIEEAEEDGDFEKDVSTLLKSAIEFSDLEVGDVYTPRIDVVLADIDAPKSEIRRLFISSEYSRIPIYRDNPDNIIGLLCYKDLFGSKEGTPTESILKPTIFVTKTQKISDLLKTLQDNRLHLAVVVDEYGSTAGIITVEDIIEEIVGEIWDEHDNITEDITPVGDCEYIVSGKANIERVLEALDIEATAKAQTVNGWAMEMLGRIAAEGDVFRTDEITAEVTKMNGRRIESLRITRHLPDDAEAEAAVH